MSVYKFRDTGTNWLMLLSQLLESCAPGDELVVPTEAVAELARTACGPDRLNRPWIEIRVQPDQHEEQDDE